MCVAYQLIENVGVPPRLSIVVPAYNEATRLGTTIPAILAYLNEARSDAPHVTHLFMKSGADGVAGRLALTNRTA